MKKIVVYIVSIFFCGLVIWNLTYPNQEMSATERRKLQQFPELSVKTVLNGKFMSQFEAYAADQFPLRDGIRELKADIAMKFMGKTDNDGYYEKDGYLSQMEYPLDEGAIQYASQLFGKIHDEYLQEAGCNVYYSVIPDKNYFLADNHLKMDYDKLVNMLRENLDDFEYIDIFEELQIEDYYKTDTHWRQEKIQDVAEKLLAGMGTVASDGYKMVDPEVPFYGVYYGQSALGTKPEDLYYMTNEVLDSCEVYDYQNDRMMEIYDLEKLSGNDPYEVFLGGPLSLLEITNSSADSDNTLIVYRDSFGSSIAPYFVHNYAKVVLVDIRYLPYERAAQYIDFEEADVLFLYSTLVLNNSDTMK